MIFGSGLRANAVSESCSAKFYKITRKTVVMEYFLLVELQTYNLKFFN